MVDRRVRLDRAGDRAAVRRLDVAAGGADEAANRSGWSAADGAFTRTTAISVVGSVPTIVAGYVAPPLKPTRMFVAPWTTWSLVTMSPLRSTTKPEPSAPTRCLPPGVKNVGGTTSVWVSVMSTTAGDPVR